MNAPDVREEIVNIVRTRRRKWREKCLPRNESVQKIIPDDQLQVIWQLNKFAVSEDGKILDPNLAMNLVHFYVTQIACDR